MAGTGGILLIAGSGIGYAYGASLMGFSLNLPAVSEAQSPAVETQSSASPITVGDFCPKCGAKLAGGESFCRMCGARL
jgi:hypothetical protein